MAKAFGKRAPAVELAVAVGIGEHANAIAARAFVFFRPLVRVRLDHQQPALARSNAMPTGVTISGSLATSSSL